MANKEVKLPSGATATIGTFKGRHVREAQRIAGQDTDRMVFAIISAVVLIDGKAIVMEDLDEMEGRDVLALMAEIGAVFQ